MDVVVQKERRTKADARYVYFVRAKRCQVVKIGIANDVRARFAALQTNSPDALKLLGVIRSAEAAALESSLHARFGHRRTHGEWFQVHDELTAFIKEHAVSLDDDRANIVREVVVFLRDTEAGRLALESWQAQQTA